MFRSSQVIIHCTVLLLRFNLVVRLILYVGKVYTREVYHVFESNLLGWLEPIKGFAFYSICNTFCDLGPIHHWPVQFT